MYRLGEEKLNLQDIEQIVFHYQSPVISEHVMNKIENSFLFLQELSSKKLIYGINTGLGPMAQYRVSDTDLVQMQYNAIRSHSSGMGAKLPDDCVRAALLARLSSFSHACSGVHPQVVEILLQYLSLDINPVIFEHGGVGASGDLVQLAHIALCMLGESDFTYKGHAYDFTSYGNLVGEPLKIRLREGLALINGTSVMTGIGLVNLIKAKRILQWACLHSLLINEIFEAFDDSFSDQLNSKKPHNGQSAIAAFIRSASLTGSRLKKRASHVFDEENIITEKKVQEYYSLRCVPQILGPVLDTILGAENVLVNEFNSVNDNPIIDVEAGEIFHGGNFHGDYVSLEMDKLKLALVKLSMLAERQLNYVLNDNVNKVLPPFVNLGKLGVNFGLQGMQFTAVSTVAENQTLSSSMYVHSIPNNNDNQDIVSMGTNSANMCRRVIENTSQVMAIELLALSQAVDYLNIYSQLSAETKQAYDFCRNHIDTFSNDLPKYRELNVLSQAMLNHKFENPII